MTQKHSVETVCDACGAAETGNEPPHGWTTLEIAFVSRRIIMDVCAECERGVDAWLTRLAPGGLRVATGHGHPASPGPVPGAADEPAPEDKPPAAPAEAKARPAYRRPMSTNLQTYLDGLVDEMRRATSPSALQESAEKLENFFNTTAVEEGDEKDILAIIARRKYALARG